METAPTTNPDYKVKASRPGLVAAVVFVVFVAGLITFMSMVKV